MLTPIKLDAAEYVNFTGMYRNSSNYIHICKYVIKIYDYIYYQDASSLVPASKINSRGSTTRIIEVKPCIRPTT